jgi:hypothetical protein
VTNAVDPFAGAPRETGCHPPQNILSFPQIEDTRLITNGEGHGRRDSSHRRR